MLVYSDKTKSVTKPHPNSFILRPGNETTDHILKHGLFERSLIDWCQQYCSKDKNMLDIGAHVGTYSVLLAPRCKHVYAFEAQEMTYYQLCGAIALNNLHNITARHGAIGSNIDSSVEKMATLRITSEDGGGSSIRDLPTNKKCITTETVKVKTIDSYKIDNISFIKMDIEGSELDALMGMTKTLEKSDYPHIMFECWQEDWFAEEKEVLFNYLQNVLPYTVHPISGFSNMFLAAKKLKE